MGRRPAIRDPKVRARLLELVRAGVPLAGAATNAGITPRSLMSTLQKARDAEARADAGEPPHANDWEYVAFAREIAEARSTVMARNVALVQKAARGGYVLNRTTREYRDDSGRLVTETTEQFAPMQWQAARWLLTVSFRKDFGADAQQVDPVMEADAGVSSAAGGAGGARALESVAARLAEVRASREADGGEVVDAEVVDDGP